MDPILPDDAAPPFAVDDLLWLIAEMPRSCSTPEELLDDCALREIDLAPAELLRLIACATAAGLVAHWKDDALVLVTLSPLGARRLDVALTPDSQRWFPVGDIRLEEQPPKRPPIGWEPRDLAAYRDPTQPEPLDVLVREEQSGSFIGPDSRRLADGSHVFVREFLGLHPTWPVRMPPGAPCPGCQDKRLRRAAYCFLCHRSGVDHLMPPIEPDLTQATARTKYRTGKLAGGQGPAPASSPGKSTGAKGEAA